MSDVETIYLKAPDFSDKNILGYRVGMRPYRRSGMRLEPEYIQHKLIIHNYGYGGSGLTLCWGGAKEVLDILQQEQANNPELTKNKTIAVLGAGVIGLSTAYELLTEGYTVNVYADAFSPHLTSNVAAGILSAPSGYDQLSPEKNALLQRMLAVSIQRFTAIKASSHPEFAGVKLVTDYHFAAADSTNTLSSKFTRLFSDVKEVEVHFDNGIIKTGQRINELGLDGQLFMTDLQAKVILKGGSLSQRRFESIGDIGELNEPVIINCTSMGSQMLFNDNQFTPIRGHLIDFKLQEGVDYSFDQTIPGEPDYWVKLYPWSDRLILGGMYERDSRECAVEQNVVTTLLKYARDCFKSPRIT